MRPHRLMVRTPGFHPGNLSSILGGATKLKGNKVKEIRKNSHEIIRIEEQEYQGHDLIDCRIYYDDNGEWRPTKKGISLSKNTAQEVVEAILQTMEESNWNDFAK